MSTFTVKVNEVLVEEGLWTVFTDKEGSFWTSDFTLMRKIRELIQIVPVVVCLTVKGSEILDIRLN